MKHKAYSVNALVKLRSKDDRLEICEVGAEVKQDFISNLNDLYGMALLASKRKFSNLNLHIVSIKVSPGKETVNIIVNVLVEGKHDKTEIIETNNHLVIRNLHRLLKYVEAKALAEKNGEFQELLHLRIIADDPDDLPSTKF